MAHLNGKQELLKQDEIRAKAPDQFEIQSLLGTGSFSYVFQVVDKSKPDQGPVALKILAARHLNRGHARSAAHEISIMHILKHDNILKIKSFLLSENLIYMVMELAPVGSLYDLIKQRGTLDENTLFFIMKQLASALDYMHNFNLIHGDIKPDNILITQIRNDMPTLKICDFGLSIVRLSDTREFKYKSGSFFYMAPEVHFGIDVDCRCDIWSLGVLMYKCMFGRKIYPVADNERDKFKLLLQCGTPINYEGSERYSETCMNYLKSMLCFNKSDRWDYKLLSCHEFISNNNYIDVSFRDEIKFLQNATTQIQESFKQYAKKDYGHALVYAFEAILNLKIHYNLLVSKDAVSYERKKSLFEKILEYKQYGDKLENALMLNSTKEKEGSTFTLSASDAEIRSCLASTPTLLQGFDIALTANMYEREGRVDKAIEMYHQAIPLMLNSVSKEPEGQRKDLIGGLIKKWIAKVEEFATFP